MYGENIFMTWTSGLIDPPKGNVAVDSWYSEKKDYLFGLPNPPNFFQVGHFTQVVWVDTKQLGCGVATNM
jgi:hypothetical protein